MLIHAPAQLQALGAAWPNEQLIRAEVSGVLMLEYQARFQLKSQESPT